MIFVAAVLFTGGCADKQAATAVPDMTPESIAENAPAETPDATEAAAETPDAEGAVTADEAKALPRFVDLGATGCVPCKMMEPVLAELQRDYGEQVQVEFIDITKDSAAAETYKIRSIPTQIYFSADGLELARHEGFIPKEDVLAKFAELGFDLGTGGVTSGTGGVN